MPCPGAWPRTALRPCPEPGSIDLSRDLTYKRPALSFPGRAARRGHTIAEEHMAGAKLVVIYPYPKDVEAFERAYTEEHVPLVNDTTMKGMTKFVATKVVGTADG